MGKQRLPSRLIQRATALIADDAVGKQTTTARWWPPLPELIRHYMELRGIGVMDVRRLFGMGPSRSIRRSTWSSTWSPGMTTRLYDRLGLESAVTEILGCRSPP